MTTTYNKAVKPRNVVVDTLLHAWMALSLVSLFPLMYFAGTLLYHVLTSDMLENLATTADPLKAVPEEQLQAMLNLFCLLVNYALFKYFCQVVLDPRVGLDAMLRSDVKRMTADLEEAA